MRIWIGLYMVEGNSKYFCAIGYKFGWFLDRCVQEVLGLFEYRFHFEEGGLRMNGGKCGLLRVDPGLEYSRYC